MNEIAINSSNLPANMEDLSKFVLVGREKLTAVRAEIRAIQRVGLAREVAEQKRQEAQQLAEAVIDAEVRIGELMRQMPTAQGARTELVPTDGKKLEKLAEMGFSSSAANRFEQMSKHPEAVAAAKAEAREADEIVTRSAVLEKIKAENAALKQKVQELEQREPEVKEVEVFPDDYRTAKSKARAYDADMRTANQKITAANKARLEAEGRVSELERKVEEISRETPMGEYFDNLEKCAIAFEHQCEQFIRWVGGYAWITRDPSKLSDERLLSVVNATQMVYEWAGTVMTNLQEGVRNEHKSDGNDQQYLNG